MTRKNKISYMSMKEFEEEFFVSNPDNIRAYLNAAISDYLFDGNKEGLLKALSKAMKWAKVSNVATKSQLSRQGIYNAIRPGAHPEFTTVLSMLHGAGFHVTVS